MRKRDLLNRIKELERRLAEVEARPMPTLQPIHVGWPIYPQPTVAPYWTPGWVVTSAIGYTAPALTADTSITGTTANGPHSVGHTFTGSPC